jgi:DNA-binding NarL/FixJ family response regulator
MKANKPIFAITKSETQKQIPKKGKKKTTMSAVSASATFSGSDSLLSQRETQILELISRGLSSKHIADAFTISKDTVETHRKKILKKLQAGNMVQAVANAFRYKILK